MNIAIIGAGFSACVLYKNLKVKNHNVKLFEKARGAGGRCSTRYIEDKKIDHGTPFFKVSSKEFEVFCEKYLKIDVLKKENDYFYPNNGMNKICSSLINNDDLYRQTKIIKIYKKDDKWSLEDEKHIKYEGFDKLFITIPATQVLELDMNLPQEFKELLSKVKYSSVASMLIYSYEKNDFNFSYLNENTFFKKVINNSKKYNYKNFNSFVFHVNEEKSKNINNKDEAKKLILEKLSSLDIKNLDKNFTIIPHLWKYGFVSKGLDKEFLYDKKLQLGFCGDYFGRKNLQSAFDSSLKLFENIQKT